MSQHPALVRFAYWLHCILALINVKYKSKAMKMPVKIQLRAIWQKPGESRVLRSSNGLYCRGSAEQRQLWGSRTNAIFLLMPA